MERIGDASQAEAKVLRDMQEIVSNLRRLSGADVTDVRSGIAKLREIRSSVYENLNQIQHEYLLLRGLAWLLGNGFGPEVAWEWNPRQTGSGSEPDLRGCVNGRILVCAEACTSENPIGTIDGRMKDTLAKLSLMEGQRFYFVGTAGMAMRAETKVRRANWSIEVVQI